MYETRKRKQNPSKRAHDSISQRDSNKYSKHNKYNPLNYPITLICIIGLIFFIFGFKYFSFNNNSSSNELLPSPNQSNIINNKNLVNSKDNTIYIGIPTLGDYGCPQTIKSLVSQALYPDNIFIGIYQQNDENDPDCLSFLDECKTTKDENILKVCKFYRNNHIKINRTTVIDGAKGPVYGRYMTMNFYNNEKFIIMMDSHTIFRHNWDLYLLSWYYNIDNKYRDYAMITHYPWGGESLERRTNKSSPKYRHEVYSYHICGTFIEGAPNYMPRNANGCFAKTNIDPKNELKYKPIRVPFFAGGFSFVKSIFWLKHVKWDPYMLYIFNGEEFGISSRGWTSGYDFYSPPFDICAHWYDKGPKRKSPHVRNPNVDTQKLRDKSEKRINYMWGLWKHRYPNLNLDKMNEKEISNVVELRELDKYGLGNKRTIEQYWKFAGIDMVKKNITVFKEDIYANGGLKYVPWNN